MLLRAWRGPGVVRVELDRSKKDAKVCVLPLTQRIRRKGLVNRRTIRFCNCRSQFDLKSFFLLHTTNNIEKT